MQNEINKVIEFHDKFCRFYQKTPTTKIPEHIDIKYGDQKKLRLDLIQEELDELKIALNKDDLIGTADAFGDLLYVVFGGIIAFGLQDKIKQVFDEIHDSNMSKLTEAGEPIIRKDGKVLKSNLYRPPNIEQFF